MIIAAPPSRTRAWFDLARAGNFPSVWSNVLAALLLASEAGAAWPPVGRWLLVTLAATLAYAGGATLNDVADAGFDRLHRPERAIPRRVITRRGAATIGAVQLGAAFAILVGGLQGSAGWAAALVGCILLYDAVHKRWAGSVVLMAGCRVLLALTIASLPGLAFTPPLMIWAGVLFAYIVTISVLARAEYKAGAAAGLGKWVGRLLACMPLLDAVALLAIGSFAAALVCALAIPLGRIAQRLAAST